MPCRLLIWGRIVRVHDYCYYYYYCYFFSSSSYSKDDFSDKFENYLLLWFSSDILLHFYSQHSSRCWTFLASVNLTKTPKNETPTQPHPPMLWCVTQKCFNIYMLDKICYNVQILCFSYTGTFLQLSFWQFWKITNVTWILERYIGRVGEQLLRARISSLKVSNLPLQINLH